MIVKYHLIYWADLWPSDQPEWLSDCLSEWLMFVHSVQLARRVLQLERANTSLRNEMEKEKAKKDLLGKEVHVFKS